MSGALGPDWEGRSELIIWSRVWNLPGRGVSEGPPGSVVTASSLVWRLGPGMDISRGAVPWASVSPLTNGSKSSAPWGRWEGERGAWLAVGVWQGPLGGRDPQGCSGPPAPSSAWGAKAPVL